MLATLFLSAVAATAMPAGQVELKRPLMQMVQLDCGGAAQRVVAETGGTLLSVSPGPDGTCSVTVLIPGNGSDDRPRRETRTVPAG
ncbi:hypothetical protein [Rhizobium sp. EC-SD404]|uniref:hypothetical protein n=1 Tax=Rhizobium sp. EC-SD404 TaxID=2038389 RepID=UPI001259ABE2|nr:hypothetical protein [Rhizobium sp. EC-SD404]VVT14266.1 conserved exported hypothetical protein [Rhizobium sp. EC-SD404]